MKTRWQATETLNIEQAAAQLSISVNWSLIVLKRLAPMLPDGKLKILEIGAAQGRALIGLAKNDHEVYGVEPYIPAIHIAKKLATKEKVAINICGGRAEAIPFKSNMFDLVLAFAVMEHVEKLELSLREISRVLKPGGIFWFSSASSMCPRQYEIKGFPLFGWYPDRLKKKIMKWAMLNKQDLVGHTEHPALHWWTPTNTRQRLNNVGLNQIWDRWDLHLPEETQGWHRTITEYAKQYTILRRIGDILIPGCSYAARKTDPKKWCGC